MIRYAAAAAALMATGVQDSGSPEPVEYAHLETQVVLRQQVIIRVPRQPRRVPATAVPVQWREKDGPRCIDARQIAAARPQQTSVDLYMRDDHPVRAILDGRCKGLDYYSGMYVRPGDDGQICADRDVIRSRMGGVCEITEFRTLQPSRR